VGVSLPKPADQHRTGRQADTTPGNTATTFSLAPPRREEGNARTAVGGPVGRSCSPQNPHLNPPPPGEEGDPGGGNVAYGGSVAMSAPVRVRASARFLPNPRLSAIAGVAVVSPCRPGSQMRETMQSQRVMCERMRPYGT
jgi:hypothetical protein